MTKICTLLRFFFFFLQGRAGICCKLCQRDSELFVLHFLEQSIRAELEALFLGGFFHNLCQWHNTDSPLE